MKRRGTSTVSLGNKPASLRLLNDVRISANDDTTCLLSLSYNDTRYPPRLNIY
jgi:hypothetical protein